MWLVLLATALGGLTFVGMQAFEWSKLIFHDGVGHGVIHLEQNNLALSFS